MFKELIQGMSNNNQQTGKKAKLLAILNNLYSKLPTQYQMVSMIFYRQLCHKIEELPEEQIEFYIKMFIEESKVMLATLEGEGLADG